MKSQSLHWIGMVVMCMAGCATPHAPATAAAKSHDKLEVPEPLWMPKDRNLQGSDATVEAVARMSPDEAKAVLVARLYMDEMYAKHGELPVIRAARATSNTDGWTVRAYIGRGFPELLTVEIDRTWRVRDWSIIGT